ncbi:hypothetical protein EST38_g7086 [Candolleomyces aberdarensis]|uniref:Uncharacterized protein n=1 Tax=Candolleomyces aberdarensis TaxID=2316362 RepID=A0A4Q2DGH6_9AGAR|nr:hypothetical protein EST38_g7086 [Candolleomyces aberdarensis]
MPLEPGLYRIRTMPPPELQPEYATGEERDNGPVMAWPKITPFGIQVWEVARAEDNQWIITAPGGPANGGWGRANDGPEEDVLFTTTIRGWNIDLGEDGRCVISVPTTVIGAIWAVTVKDEHLAVKSYPVIRDMQLPAWSLIPVNSD